MIQPLKQVKQYWTLEAERDALVAALRSLYRETNKSQAQFNGGLRAALSLAEDALGISASRIPGEVGNSTNWDRA